MRRTFAYLFAALVFALALTFPQSFTVQTVKADGQTLQEKCDECNIRNNEQYEHCVAIHGLDEVRCSDQFNAGVVHCFRNFCEQ